MPDAPLPAGRRVYHCNQVWPAGLPGGTARIIVAVLCYDGSYEYQVLTAEDFSRRPGPDNPETRRTWWSSLATVPAEENPDA
jgi:hypothetical protein